MARFEFRRYCMVGLPVVVDTCGHNAGWTIILSGEICTDTVDILRNRIQIRSHFKAIEK